MTTIDYVLPDDFVARIELIAAHCRQTGNTRYVRRTNTRRCHACGNRRRRSRRAGVFCSRECETACDVEIGLLSMKDVC